MRQARPSAIAVYPRQIPPPAAGCSCGDGTAPDRALQLFIATNQRVDTANASKLVKVGGEVFHTILPACLLFIVIDLIAGIRCLVRLVFARSVRDKVNHVEAADFVFAQQIGSL